MPQLGAKRYQSETFFIKKTLLVLELKTLDYSKHLTFVEILIFFGLSQFL